TPPGALADSNTPRLSPLRNPMRYGVDQDVVDNNTGLPPFDGLPDHPYNFAPYHVVPFTNWPDGPLGGPPDLLWPDGPGNPGGADLPEGNPVGNPGFGDARWLADHEPLRWLSPGLDGVPGTPDDFEAFSHWRHMTNIAHANNGFRIVVGIHDVGDLNGDGLGQLVTGLSDPVEQWLAVKPQEALGDPIPIFNPITGNAVFRNSVDFGDRWLNWFSLGVLSYAETYLDPTLVPPNFYDLGDLDGDGFAFNHPDGDLPQDEFVAGSARHAVSSILADTDGDGFTDSFWFLAPTMTERGIRQIVAMRIIDNSAMLNANVATRFLRNDSDFGFGPGSKTAGHTPADLALVGQLLNIPPDVPIPPNWNVGILDNPANHETVPDPFFYGDTTIGYDVDMWDTATTPPSGGRALNYLQQIGIIDQNFILNPNFSTELNIAADRLRYWQLAGLRPLAPVGGLTPFGFTEELELRMFHGQNYPWIASRFERAVQANVRSHYIANPGDSLQLLHANLAREESSEYLDQLTNRELVFDHRRKLTMYSGARNDEMPPWLWWRWELPTGVPPGGAEEANFRAQARTKLDLREPDNLTFLPGAKSFRDRLAPTLLLALVDGDEVDGSSYFGPYDSGPLVTGLTFARWLAAGLAANIIESRDADSNYGFVQNSSVPLPQVGSWDQYLPLRFLGMEKQPFLVEALIGHVYKATTIATDIHPGTPPIAPGHNILCADSPTSTIVVVQVANPFDSVLDVSDFRLDVFGKTVSLNVGGTINPGAAKTFYAIVNELDGDPFHDPWVNALQLDATFSDKVNVTDPPSDISTNRSDYDSGVEEHAIELVRIISSFANGNFGNVPVLIDRIDIAEPDSLEDFGFGQNVTGMEYEATGDCTEPFGGDPWPGVVNIEGDTHWIQWVHVSRDWDIEFNNDPGIQADERNPRYVFAAREVDPPDEDSFSTATTDDGDVVFVNFDGIANFRFHESLKEAETGVSLDFSMQMLQKDADFEQVGELLNVWMFGHLLSFVSGPPGQLDTAYIETLQTFSEFMINDKVAGEGVRANRLTVVPDVVGLGEGLVGQVVGVPDPDDPNYPIYLLNPLHAVPALPAGARVLDAFVCEGLGVNLGGSRFGNANGFTGKSTPGLININTAPPEVMRSAPHMARLVHEDNLPADNPFVRVPEAIVRYRERFGDPMDNTDPLPAYGDRGDDTFIEDLRGERGIASIGELMLITEPASFAAPPNLEPNENWQIDFAGLDPFTTTPGQSTQISTDVNDLPGNDPDIVAEDAEELNLLFAGMSNMLTTRSDVFTVYFRVRSFIQNPTTGVWDATNPEFIVDDSRYVMLVDRSEVNHPNDKPKILYLEKLPK
ncbi:MAG: hypothetical protein IIA27_11965, partial [Gemmatimonadetes bacterium]|nr:hypothetical protein [Gemmatimonadota bacterium]